MKGLDVPHARAENASPRLSQLLRVWRRHSLKSSLDATRQAGLSARDATLEIDKRCAELEATSDRECKRHHLIAALEVSVDAVRRLAGDDKGSRGAAVMPITKPDRWLTAVSGQNTDRAIAISDELRRTPEFSDFLEEVKNAMHALRLSAPARKCIAHRLTAVVLPEAPPLTPLTATLQDAGDVLGEALATLRGASTATNPMPSWAPGISLVIAWRQARTAQSMLEGGLVLCAPILVEASSPLHYEKHQAQACVSVIIGAALVSQAAAEITEGHTRHGT